MNQNRLSTIRNADVIFAMKDGEVVETGSHDKLMGLKGLYYSLVVTQTSGIEPMKKEKKGIPIKIAHWIKNKLLNLIQL